MSDDVQHRPAAIPLDYTRPTAQPIERCHSGRRTDHREHQSVRHQYFLTDACVSVVEQSGNRLDDLLTVYRSRMEQTDVSKGRIGLSGEETVELAPGTRSLKSNIFTKSTESAAIFLRESRLLSRGVLRTERSRKTTVF